MGMRPPEEIVKDCRESIAENEQLIVDGKHNQVIGMLILEHRTLGRSLYLARRDVAGFREHMMKSAQYDIREMQLFIADAPRVCGNSIAQHESILCACVGGDFVLAKEVAVYLMRVGDKMAQIGKDDKKYFECPRTHNAGLGYTLVGLMLDDDEMVNKYLPLALEKTSKKGMTSWHGQAIMMEGIFKNDASLFDEGLANFVATYHNYMKTIGSGFETDLCVRGIALANLARHRGLKITLPDSKYLPKELVM